MPTSYAASPPSGLIWLGNEPPPVWPWMKRTARGIAFYPLYPHVPEAAERNPALGELLAVFDAVRGAAPGHRPWPCWSGRLNCWARRCTS